MRFKIQLSIPAIIAAFCFILGLTCILWYHLTTTNGKFEISMGVATLAISLITLLFLTAIIFIFLRRSNR